MTEYSPTDRELEVLKVLWERGDCTVREVCDTLNSTGAELAYTTVLTIMQIMERKGLLGHKKVGKAYIYSAELSRDRTFRQLAGGFLDKVFDGAVDQYLLHAMESRRLSTEQLERLEEMIAAAKRRSKRGSTRKGGGQ
ncbi:MAG: BlaI/MecI/CopY family transcriptional regulator [Bryobacteraceae bacterium]|nr:BlaI/MecI/CopY family transcriptional regulator [Bryobacteraceae bacterium]